MPPPSHSSSTHPSANDSPSTEESVDRVLEALRQLVRASPLSQRQIERQHDWRRGYLSQVLTGHITLTVHHVLAVTHSVEQPVSDFFADTLEETREWRSLDEISEKLSRYDAAFDELRAKGYLDAGSGEPSDR